MMTLNHGFSGYVVGQLAMPLLRRHANVPTRALSWAFFLGAMAPDMDILVRWVGGRGAYFSGLWYAHRSASHSILGTLVLGLLLAGVLYRPLARNAVGEAPLRPRVAYAWLAGCAWAGGMLHIVGDLFTPRLPMPVFWPLPQTFGAWSHIGWFSPYLLWLFVTTIALGWGGAALLPRLAAMRAWAPAMLWGLYGLATYRWLHYLAQSHYEHSAQWYDYQRTLLPEAMITPFANGVHALWHWFTG